MKLPREFYERDTIQIAKDLLGTFLVTNLPEGKVTGRIVETEGYLGSSDPAAHSFRGKTPRNAVMFGSPGHAYVYFIYGMYYCVNIVTAPEGVGDAVLIRALEPVKGIPLMQQRRKTTNTYNLCSGPGKLTKALGIDKNLNGAILTGNTIYILSSDSFPDKYPPDQQPGIVISNRIGITQGKEHPLRFYLKENKFISRP